MRRFLLANASVLLFAVPAQADDTGRVETVVVTATRTPQPASKTGESITVITAADLEEQQIAVATDVLQETPGLMVNRNGGVGQQSTISLRGADAGQTVVLVDGVRINDPSATDDTAVMGDLLVNNFDRIEILRGPQSTLYGSDAIGGVVNVITKRGGTTPFVGTLTGEGGSFDTVHLNAAASGSTENIDYGAGLNFYDTRGTQAADRANGNTEANGYLHYGATSNVRVHLDPDMSIDLRTYYVRTHAAFDDGFTPDFLVADSEANAANQLFAGYAGFNLDLLDGTFHNRLAVLGTTSSRKFFDSSFDTIHLNSDDFADVLRIEYQGTFDPTPDDEVTFGAETEHSQFRGDSFSTFFGDSTDTGRSRNTGVYLQAQHTFLAALTLTGGARYEHDDTFGSHTSLKVAAAYQIPNAAATLRANYGDGFKAPSLFERFSEFRPSDGTPPLKPETAKGWEVGIDKALLGNRVTASLTYFERRTNNLIEFDDVCPGPDRPFGCYQNVGRTRASGVETEVSAHVTDELTIAANYTNLSAIDLTTNPTEALQRNPHSKANGTVTWAPNRDWSVGASATYVGPRFDDGTGPRVHLPDYLLVNIFGSWSLTERYDVFARVENLFDRHYEPLVGFGAPGRAAFIGLRARI